MLGGIKVKGDDGAGVPLFRLLARRWTPVVPLKTRRFARTALQGGEPPPPARKWISKPRDLYAHQKIEQPKPSSSWNPWLWMK